MLSTIEEKKESFNNLFKNYIKESSQDFKFLAYEEKSPIFDELHLLNVKAVLIIMRQKGIEQMLIDPLKHTVEQLLKECSKDDQINSALTNTMTEVQQQSSNIV